MQIMGAFLSDTVIFLFEGIECFIQTYMEFQKNFLKKSDISNIVTELKIVLNRSFKVVFDVIAVDFHTGDIINEETTKIALEITTPFIDSSPYLH